MGQTILLLFLMYSLLGLGISLYETQIKKNFYGLSNLLLLLGAFVWADGVIFGLFWSLASIVLLIYNHVIVTLLVFSLFWTVRSAGEVIYWFLEQFASKHLNPPSTLFLYRFFPNESVWFVMQIQWQCILVVSLWADVILIKHL